MAGMARRRKSRCGELRRGLAGKAWHGVAGLGLARQGRLGWVWQGMSGRCTARLGSAIVMAWRMEGPGETSGLSLWLGGIAVSPVGLGAYDGGKQEAEMDKEESKKALAEAKARLGGFGITAVHQAGLIAAVRALVAVHPHQQALRNSYDSFVGQLLASPGFLQDPDRGLVLRELTEVLFQPPAEP